MTEQTPGQHVSIRDVARVAGVSRQTVSRVLNSHPSLRPETRLRVQAVIDELHYRPNLVARALGSQRSRTLGVLASQRSQYGPSAAILGIERAAQDAGYLVNTTNLSSSDPDAIRDALQLQVDHMVAGIVIIAPQTRTLDLLDEMATDIPYVMLHSRESGDPHELFVDQLAGARAATRHLIGLGHRDIVHLAGPQEWIEADVRMQGYLCEMSEADMPITAPVLGDWTAAFGHYAGVELARSRSFTAVFSSNDQMALGLIHAFRSLGWDVPGDVSVVGFDDIPDAAHFWPPLTTVRQDFEELGRQCVARLLDTTRAQAQAQAEPLEPMLVVRNSTARL
ncbi:MAG TPA: LacI family DNA-binding transcriptional regulator [Propionibacteriaceae bacterium]|nr:LacI family DNA-binding transcriptional regulator [Propionibacteriaceae bacterium]